MKISTFSIVVGDAKCNANCPFCVSKMTGFSELKSKSKSNKTSIHSRNLQTAIMLAKAANCTTALLTGKGEPTLYPDDISLYLEELSSNFPLIELQTNALAIGDMLDKKGNIDSYIDDWCESRLSTIAISVVDVLEAPNQIVYRKDYPDLSRTIKFIHSLGLTVRLGVMMTKIGVHDEVGVKRVIDFCKENKVGQLTFRPIRKPKQSKSSKIESWVDNYGVDAGEEYNVRHYITSNAKPILKLEHGATIYDFDGQNVCLTDCLTNHANQMEFIRTLIYYSSGRISYSWEDQGAVILTGTE
jgi:organic radical activating enzyme